MLRNPPEKKKKLIPPPQPEKIQPDKTCDCGTPIIFRKTRDGKTVPLDLKADCYLVSDGGPLIPAGECVRFRTAFVNHFNTCKLANLKPWMRRNKKMDP